MTVHYVTLSIEVCDTGSFVNVRLSPCLNSKEHGNTSMCTCILPTCMTVVESWSLSAMELCRASSPTGEFWRSVNIVCIGSAGLSNCDLIIHYFKISPNLEEAFFLQKWTWAVILWCAGDNQGKTFGVGDFLYWDGPSVRGSARLYLLYMIPVWREWKKQATVMSSTRKLLKKHHYDNKPTIM